MQIKLTIAAGLLAASACGAYVYVGQLPKLSEADAIVLGDFTNTTGEAVFDESLREALGVSLAQSPYVNVVSSEKVTEALRALGRPANQPVTRDLAGGICERTKAKAFVAGGISAREGKYEVSLEALSCAGGAAMAGTRAEAGNVRQVLHALGKAATELRKEFGEEQSSIQKFDTPLERATSPSLEALKFYSEGRRLTRDKGALHGVAPLQKAVELDPRFALAYSSLAVDHYNLNQNARASEEIRQAFEMADRQTARERLQITTLYYDLGIGDVKKAIASYKQWATLYPRDDVPWGDMSSEYFLIGDYEEAAANAKQALRLEPSSVAWYENLSTADIALQRLGEADALLKEALAKKLEDPSLHANLYALSFLRNDAAAMQRELSATTGQASGEDTMLAMQADTEAFSGRLKKARELSRQAVESAQKAELAEPAAIWEGLAALREAAFGNKEEARKGAEEVLRLAPESRDAQTLAALILARTGETKRAQAILEDLSARYVSNTVIQMVWIPAIRAQNELVRQNSRSALHYLEVVTPYERGQMIGNLSNCCLIPIYLRGEAYLAAGQGPQAVNEFQKILDDKGVVVNCWAGSLALLGKARGQVLAGYKAAARMTYAQFLAQWNQADADVPVYKTARSEYAKLK
jgi:eukaryotic-like serine/threonine-protein kinase